MKYTFTPFPGAVAPAVLAAMARPYSVDVNELPRLHEIRFREIFFSDAAQVTLLPQRREALFELILNSFTDASPILLGVNGPISSQMMTVAKALNKDFEILDASYGSVFREAQLTKALDQESYSAIFFVEIDPYSGVRLDIPTYAELIRRTQPDAMIFVDASSALGAGKPLRVGPDVDVYYAGLDGSFGVPAGLSVVALSERAGLKTLSNAGTGLTLNFSRQQQLNEKPPVFASCLYPQLNALNKQLDLIFLEGLEARSRRIEEIGAAVRTWAEENGFTTLCESGSAAGVATVLKRKPIFTTRAIVDYCASYGIFIGDCPDELAEEYFVIAHQNQCDRDELEILLSVLNKFVAEYDTELKIRSNPIADFFRRKA